MRIFFSPTALRRLFYALPASNVFFVKQIPSHRLMMSMLNTQPRRSLHIEDNASAIPITEENALAIFIKEVQKQDPKSFLIQKIAEKHPRIIAEQTSDDNTALHEAAKRGDVEMIRELKKLFSTHFNVNHKCHCYKKRTPLLYAVEGGHEAAVDELLSYGADVNITDENGWSALDYAMNGFKLKQNKTVFENIISTVLKHEGKSKKFPEETQKIILQIEKNKVELLRKKSMDAFCDDYEQSSKQTFQSVQKKYLDDIRDRKAIGPGNSR